MSQFSRPVTSEYGFTETKPLIKCILALWIVLLFPWFLSAGIAAQVFEAGDIWQAYLFVSSVWLYPVSVYIAFFSRQRIPLLVLLPLLNVAGLFLADF